MPRNGSGTYSVTNTYSSGQTITAAIINANFSDVGSEITNSVAKDGQTTMTGPLKASNGSASSPSVTFGGDTDTGFYRKSADTIGIAIGGAEVAEISSKGSTLIPVGAIMDYALDVAPAGWVRLNGLTIGNAASSATERANADTQALFQLLWNNFSNSVLPVSGGRGASAAADFAANKTITLFDLRGRARFGIDTMGNSAANRITSTIVNANTMASTGGSETTTLTTTELPAHTHSLSSHTHAVTGTTVGASNTHTHSFSATTSSNGDHAHTLNYVVGNETISSTGANAGNHVFNAVTSPSTSTAGAHTHTVSGTSGTESATHTHDMNFASAGPNTDTSGSAGSGAAFSNMPPTFLACVIMKL